MVAHVILHPHFAKAYTEAVRHAGSADSPDAGAVATFTGHGIALPSGTTVKVLPSATDSTDPDALEICVLIGSDLYCVEFRPPITISTT